MHSYSSDHSNRFQVVAYLAFASVALGLFWSSLIEYFSWSIPWWVETPSTLAFFGGLFALYDKWLWRKRIFGWRVSPVIDLEGSWYGIGYSSDDRKRQFEIMVYIRQTWTSILITTETEDSRSTSQVAVLNNDLGENEGLFYIFRNTPKELTAGTMHAHRGLAYLKLEPDASKLIGGYFTEHRRHTEGTMELRRVSKERLTRVAAATEFYKTKTDSKQ